MFKNLILASATAAVALTVAADFSAGTFDLTAPAAAAQQQINPGPAIPGTPGGLKSNVQTDVFPTPLFPQANEGQPGKFYCGGQPNQKPTAVSVVVNSQGSKAPGSVEVVVEFSGGKKERQRVVLDKPNAQKGIAVAIPASAWAYGKASFTIRVDDKNKIAETNESNNVAKSFCNDPTS